MSTRSSRLSLPSFQATASANARWISRPMIRHGRSSVSVRSGRGARRATRHLLIRAYGASGKVARGGHVTSSGSQPTVYRRPARTFVLPAPRVQDGLTISPSPFRKQADSKAPTNHIPDNGKAERFVQTSLREWAYARAYSTSQHRAAELPIWLHRYNWHRPHGGIGAKPPVSRLSLPRDNVSRLHS